MSVTSRILLLQVFTVVRLTRRVTPRRIASMTRKSSKVTLLQVRNTASEREHRSRQKGEPLIEFRKARYPGT
jgi:hypothetical protein